MKALIWVLGICLVSLVILYSFKEEVRHWLLPNTIILNKRGSVDVQHLRIDWTYEAANDTITIYDKGVETSEPYEARGRNVFLLYYDQKLVGEFEQFKMSANTPHTYLFSITAREDSIFTGLKILGPDIN
ncbi:hypothetical protein LVD15_19945 [Fulvivirga maritima]|uniref:hypothetical protein n=1 Tax=Fulvivirga maritima TaxID=2904247 RepID=UPI001F2A385F|nr:hypothetical protein [Fulvivirga maritima]UII25559.1 hypothetical protein LVD15_19945 [Fulvivirga maritima]